MAFRIRRSRSQTAYEPLDDDPYGHGELHAGERIGPPLSRGRVRRFATRGLFLLALLGAGWAVAKDPSWIGWSVDQASALYRATEDRLRRSSDPTALAAATTPRLQSPLPAVEPVSPPQPILPQASMNTAVIPTPASAAPSPVTTASLPAAKSDAPADADWQPPRADPSDPLQVRAEAVGLHPDLSRAVLARLSAEDFRNAGVAIKTALVETPDDGVHAWPRQRKPEQALFQVRFVPGAGPNCRRYVVVVTKDRWSTTALPMERCGTPVRRDAARAEETRPSPVRRP